jgi:serine/threonine-protein kinase RsbW
MIPARLERMRVLRAFLEAFCASTGVGSHSCLRLNLVLEELFTNTVRHGHGGDSDSPVWVSLVRKGGQVRLTYEDSAPPFNPYAKLPAAPPDSSIEMRKLGGLGVLLTKEMAASRDYAYIFGRNRIRLSMAVQEKRGQARRPDPACLPCFSGGRAKSARSRRCPESAPAARSPD